MAHGKSYGTKGLISDHKKIINDFVTVAAKVRERHASNLPFFVIGHSMGTLVAINSCTRIPGSYITYHNILVAQQI